WRQRLPRQHSRDLAHVLLTVAQRAAPCFAPANNPVVPRAPPRPRRANPRRVTLRAMSRTAASVVQPAIDHAEPPSSGPLWGPGRRRQLLTQGRLLRSSLTQRELGGQQ